MITAYTLVKTLHVLAAIVWVGGTVLTVLLISRALRCRDLGRFGEELAWVARSVLGPVAMAVLVLGVATAVIGHLNFLTPWLLIGLGGVAVTAVTDIGIRGPRLKRLLAATGEGAAQDLRRLRTLALVEVAVMTLVVLAMELKPGA